LRTLGEAYSGDGILFKEDPVGSKKQKMDIEVDPRGSTLGEVYLKAGPVKKGWASLNSRK